MLTTLNFEKRKKIFELKKETSLCDCKGLLRLSGLC